MHNKQIKQVHDAAPRQTLDTRMRLYKRLLLPPYYYASLPWRFIRNRRWQSRGQTPLCVVFYHRVAARADNPWTVSFNTFRRQISWLERNFLLVSLKEAQRRIEAGENSEPCAAVTFDDGYKENCRQALPYLIEQRIPCTYFVSSQYIFSGSPFPHDVALGRPLPVNTVDDLRRLVGQGIEIGAHTRSHADLGKVTDERVMWDEVVASADELSDAVGQQMEYFAFPYGQPENLSAIAFRMAKEAGIRGVCSAFGGVNFPGGDSFHLLRIGPGESLYQLKNWASFDPRMLCRVASYCDETFPRLSNAAEVA